MIQSKSSLPATYTKAVVLCCDKEFARFAAFLISQIVACHPHRDFDICLCSAEDIVLPDSLSHLPVRLCRLNIPESIANAPGSDRISVASYLRLFMPTVFAGEYKRLLYLDADIFFRGGDLSRLLDIPLLADTPIAAVRTSHQRNRMQRHMPEFRQLGLPPSPYFNAGVLLIEVARWEAEQTLDRALQVIANHSEALIMHDQSVLNIVFRGRWSELSVAWNWMYSGRFSFLIEGCDPFLIHFAGRIKPWNTPGGEFPPHYVRPYREFFLQHYPDEGAKISQPKSIFAAPRFHRKALLKQWYDFNRFMPYMKRFDDPYCVIEAGN